MNSPLLKSLTYARPFFTTTPHVMAAFGMKPSCVDRVHVGDLPALGPEIAPQLAGDVERAEPGVVRAHVERVAGDPHVVHAAVLRLVPGDLLRMLEVAHVEHLEPPVRAARAGP